MATGGGLASIEQGKPLDVPLEEPAEPSKTWKTLAHSDSTASIDADENILADRVDSVALAHMRLDKLNKANDSLAVTRKRLGGQDSPAADREGGAAASPADTLEKKGSPGLAAGFKRLSGAFKKGMSLGKDSPKQESAALPDGASPRVRFSLDEQRPAP